MDKSAQNSSSHLSISSHERPKRSSVSHFSKACKVNEEMPSSVDSIGKYITKYKYIIRLKYYYKLLFFNLKGKLCYIFFSFLCDMNSIYLDFYPFEIVLYHYQGNPNMLRIFIKLDI